MYPWLFNVSNNLGYLDLRLNQLQGSIPDAFGHITSLEDLRLQGNHFEGGIPESFGSMCRLLSLDLSSNKLGGKLSKSIRNLLGGCTEGTLTGLCLIENKFIGSVPDLSRFSSLKELQLGRNLLNGTLTNSIGLPYKLKVLVLRENSFEVYGGHLGLCGLPLPTKCPGDESAQGLATHNGGKEDTDSPKDDLWFYLSSVIGFVVGFWGVCGTLLFKASWRHAYFNFLIDVKDWLYVTAAVTFSKLRTRLSF
ncbi:hypothetical protein Patl1_20270 [Pistacia atlantica]|uniref:Uncharacterized protein n=1 Tax=Pistacia atlantica TaxID=434234 RepID=A0ACC1BIT2_9ROSI|nr:hypothetical protein Patl1_20270 [Pistacia atlantica]